MTTTIYGELAIKKQHETTHGVLRMDEATEQRWLKEWLRPALVDLFRLLAAEKGIDVLSIEGDGYTAEQIEVSR